MIQHRISGVNWLEGTSTISNKNGELQFHASTSSLKRSDNSNLEPTIFGAPSSTQGYLILKHPESSINYLFESARGTPGYFTFNNDSFVDYLVLMPFSGGEKQNAVNHQNGRDIWYANHAQTGDSIYFFIVKEDGMIECPAVAHTGLEYYGDRGVSTQGSMKFSSSGDYLAAASYVRPFSVGIYQFKNEYPELDSIYQFEKEFGSIRTKNWTSSVEFSSDSKMIYVVTGLNSPQDDPVTLHQIAMDSIVGDFDETHWIDIDTLPDQENGDLQLAPNGKIYMSMPYRGYVGVINSPSEVGTNCEFKEIGLKLDSGGTSQFGVPNFNQSYFYTPAIDFKYKEDCSGNNYQFWGLDTFESTDHEWRFANLTSGKSEIRTGKNITYEFEEAQTLEDKYRVTLIASSGVRTDSVSKVLTIRPLLKNDFLGNDTFYCVPHDGDSLVTGITLKTAENLHCIHWNGLEPYSNLAGDTIIGYEHFHSEEYYVDTAGIYTARITNKNFCRAWDTIRVEEKPRPNKPIIERFSGSITSTTKAFRYRWFYNGQELAETDTLVFDPVQNGYYQVQLVSEFGCESRMSDSFLVDFVGIEKAVIDNEISIYPNPSTGILNVEQAVASKIVVTVNDLMGRTISSTCHNEQRNRIELKPIQEGVYIIFVSRGDSIHVVKRIMIHY